ncbi:MAG: hypothetical protein ACOC9P_01555 [bacterium]
MARSHSYTNAGVDIAAADALKRQMAGEVDRGELDPRRILGAMV